MTTPNKLKELGLLSTGEVARKMGVHRSTVWHWIQTGQLTASKVGLSQRYTGIAPADLKPIQATYVTTAKVRPIEANAKKKNGHRRQSASATTVSRKKKR